MPRTGGRARAPDSLTSQSGPGRLGHAHMTARAASPRARPPSPEGMIGAAVGSDLGLVLILLAS